MSHSFTHLLYHIVFATNERRGCLDGAIRPGLFACIGELVREQGGIPLAVNGMPEHVHLLIRLRPTTALAGLVRVIKARSSRWLHQNAPVEGFGWQTGYSAFTVSRSGMDKVRAYILDQEEHHKNRTYLDEFRALLKAHGLDVPPEGEMD